MVTKDRGDVNHRLHGLYRFFNQEFFFAALAAAFLFSLGAVAGGSQTPTTDSADYTESENTTTVIAKGLRTSPRTAGPVLFAFTTKDTENREEITNKNFVTLRALRGEENL